MVGVKGRSGMAGKTGIETRWRVVDGEDVPPELCQRFLEEWCLVYPRLVTQKEWAEENGVTPRTLANWKKDPRFRKLWRDQAEDGYASPEYTAPLIAEAHRLALNEGREFTPSEQLKAMEVFGRFVNMVSPSTIRHEMVPMSTQIESMSLEELTAVASGSLIDVDGDEVDG